MRVITSDCKISIDKSFKVEAGPGAGKTHFLINHINNVVQTSNRLRKTGKVACITYTNSAVENIIERLGEKIASHVEVSTIHSFLYKHVVKPYCFKLPKDLNLNIGKFKNHIDVRLSQHDIRKWIEDGKFSKKLKPPTSKKQILSRYPNNWQMPALRNWLSSIYTTLDSSGQVIFKADNNKAYVEKSIYGNRSRFNNNNLRILEKEILELKKLNWEKGLVDHEDILYFSHMLIKENPFILEVLKTKFPYIFIDEYQDTNLIQNDLLLKLKKLDCIVGVIGDKAQSIYNFVGANIQIFENFPVDKSSHYVIKENRRSTKEIVEFLNTLRTDIVQKPESKDKNEPNEAGAKFVFIIIGDKVKTFKRAEQIIHNNESLVSLSRKNTEANEMKVLGEEILVDELIQSALYKHDSDSGRRRMILEFIEAIEYAKDGQIQKAIKLMETIIQRNIELVNEFNLRNTSAQILIALIEGYDTYSNGSLYDFHQVLYHLFERKLNDISKRPMSNLSARGGIVKFYKSTKYKTLSSSINLSDDKGSHITIHKSKGKEYKNVFIVGDDTMREFLLSPDLDKEEHRVRYVAISRAKNNVFIQLNELNEKEESKIKKMYDCHILKV